ncbi:MAG: SRPBCC family protein [Ilumatobacter sp.]|nr:SRPBCC family protein [Ilumatobacter sp.]
MSDVTVSIDLDASPAEVWDVVEPIERHVEWMADAVAIRFETEQTRGVGTKFLCDTKVGPIKLTDHMEITAWTPPVDAAAGTPGTDGVMGVKHTGIVTGSGVFTIEPLADGSRSKFTWSEHLDFPWYLGGRLGEIIAGRFVLAAIWRRNLRSLAELIAAR